MAQDGPSKASSTTVTVVTTRQRKTHRKSRLGCGNCKLRSVKCDEVKPECKRCVASGFRCNYARSVPALQLANAPGVFKVQLGFDTTHRAAQEQPCFSLSRGLPPALRVPVATPVDGKYGSYELRPGDCEALVRFRERTIHGIGSARLKSVYREQSLLLGGSNPFLLHAFLAITFIHDAHLSPSRSLSASHRAALAFHWYHATALFGQLLARPVSTLTSTERDALWAASTLLGAAAIAHLESLDPLHSWPLKDGDPMDLDWLRLSEGKKAVWEIADPSRPESIFNCVFNDFTANHPPDPNLPIPSDALPSSFYDLFDLTPTSTLATNPYQGHTSILAQLLPKHPSADNLINFITFCSQPDPRYRHLLEANDHRALLLLAWWYAKLVNCGYWWVETRARVNGVALCVYLERDSDDPRILELLDFPLFAFRQCGQDVDAVRQRLDIEGCHVVGTAK